MKRHVIAPEQLSSDTRQLFDVINEGTDLSCVVVGAAFLDATLATLLKGHMTASSISDKLLSPNGAIGNFSVRADLAYVLGLLAKDTYEDLCVVAEIRNAFAHSHLSLSFSEKGLQDLCARLKSWRLPTFESDDGVEPTDEQRRVIARNMFNLSMAILPNRILLKALGEKVRAKK